ncbi:cellulase family glycosylhydrolase [Cellulomonas dongxiuzhuiae]|uniref:cellulase n=1 Tax=Cellulomonas dongxiuzhuiae TaxID=2819979 RepID=A0ABX8GIJ5_9CELL|nr:cellulase family glycosylhydrolase [Cellulomonas dongxiuzhuiae]MBO3095012.1 cellulase family glycosylhydrolase [Cellulomonas dongxiuzhuiae]QWC16028.1 cellulase family glycosylhydrolase [Cellulomonas dongxiuzhuiae]
MTTPARHGRIRRLWAPVVVALVALVGGLLPAVGAQGAAGCRVEYTVPSQWPGGFTADVTVTNLGDALDGWRLAWTFPSGQRVTQSWNATTSTSGGQVVATNAAYNARVASGGSVSFGFLGSWTGSNAAPTTFTLDGVTCTGQVGGSPSATPSPTASPTPVVTPSPTPDVTTSPGPTPSTSPRPTPSSEPADAMATVAAMQPGWNLGNTLDAIPDETAWGNPLTTRELLHHVRSEGYNSIRIPVTWTDHVGPAPDHTIDPVWLARVEQVVDWSLDEGFYVMLNLHHDSWQWADDYPTDREAVLTRYRALWDQIAVTFRDRSSRLVLESLNEPQFAGATDEQGDVLVQELNTDFVERVRATGGGNATRLLILPTLHTSSEQPRLDALAETIEQLDDPNLAATVHFYGWWPFSVNIAGGTRYSTEVEQDLIGSFDRVTDTFVERGVPVVIGEWALLAWDHTRPGIIQRGEFLKYLEAVGYHARTRGLTTMVWDAGQFLDRNALTWRDEGVHDMMRASWTERSGTASSDRVYLPGSGSITARSLTLNPNGTTFRGLWHDGTELVRGTDYTVDGDRLTLTGSALTRLAGERGYGVATTVEARFSQGVPWAIDVIAADVPVLGAATGTTTSFAIPAQLRGDQLATMEARYDDGSNAGPPSWTSYKEFWSSFRPDPATGTILLTPEFFAEVADGRVTLTFHFWSGEQVTYTITRTGTTVVGVPE